MGKDYKIGLMLGLIGAIAVVVWLATRPSRGPGGRMLGPSTARSKGGQPDQARGAAAAGLTAPSGQNPQRSSRQSGSAQSPTTDARWQQKLFGESPQTEPERTGTHRVEDQTPSAVRQPQTTALPARTHVVQRGENLSSISQQYYGTPDAWQRIVKANQDAIKDVNRIAPGTKLIIP